MEMYHRIRPNDLVDFNPNEVYNVLKQAGMALFGDRIIENQKKAMEIGQKRQVFNQGATLPNARQSGNSVNSVMLSTKVINEARANNEDPKEYAKNLKNMLDTGTISEAQYRQWTEIEYMR
jgi:hypothetical protein